MTAEHEEYTFLQTPEGWVACCRSCPWRGQPRDTLALASASAAAHRMVQDIVRPAKAAT